MQDIDSSCYRNMYFAGNPCIKQHVLTMETLKIMGNHKTMFLLYSTETLGKRLNDVAGFSGNMEFIKHKAVEIEKHEMPMES